MLPADVSLDLLLDGVSWAELGSMERTPVEEELRYLPPIGAQEVWAAGVTYIQSRYAREEESTRSDVYRDVYYSERPELFLKAGPGTVVGPDDEVGIRSDSAWNVPEPELALVADARGTIVAYTIGNDMSSRALEGENPLFLPQAKIYDSSCSLGPCLVPVQEAPGIDDLTIEMEIKRDGTPVWQGESSTRLLKRSPEELVDYLFMARTFDRGVILLTGTGIVPPNHVTLLEGDTVAIRITGLGTLTNVIKVVGRGPTQQWSSHHAPD